MLKRIYVVRPMDVIYSFFSRRGYQLGINNNLKGSPGYDLDWSRYQTM